MAVNREANQRAMAHGYIARLAMEMKPIVADRLRLREVVDAAQNDPPQGASDGSIKDPLEWDRMREVAEALERAEIAIKRYLGNHPK